jgi:hypothetical protein
LQKIAYDENRSMSAQVILLLSSALENEEQHKQQKKILDKIRRRRFTPPAKGANSLQLLREDRDR